MCLSMCVYVCYMCVGAHNSQRGFVNFLELEFQVVVIGIKLRSFRRGASALSSWVISLDLQQGFFKNKEQNQNTPQSILQENDRSLL